MSLADGRDKLLEMNSFRPKIAEKIVNQVKKEDSDKSLEIYLTKVFSHFNIEMEDLTPRTYFLHPTSVTTETFPPIPQEGIAATCDRNNSIIREDINLLSWYHATT